VEREVESGAEWLVLYLPQFEECLQRMDKYNADAGSGK